MRIFTSFLLNKSFWILHLFIIFIHSNIFSLHPLTFSLVNLSPCYPLLLLDKSFSLTSLPPFFQHFQTTAGLLLPPFTPALLKPTSSPYLFIPYSNLFLSHHTYSSNMTFLLRPFYSLPYSPTLKLHCHTKLLVQLFLHTCLFWSPLKHFVN